MKVQRIVFDRVSAKATKRWKDPVTGKPRQKTREFCQTVNPFNRDADGHQKTREQIYAEVHAQAKAWRESPGDGGE